MEARTLARAIALGRVVFGAALVAAPARTGGGWVGDVATPPGAQVLTEAVGARDLAMGLGTLRALSRDEGVRTWVAASLLADLADCVATVRARDALPTPAAVGVSALAGAGALSGLGLLWKL